MKGKSTKRRYAKHSKSSGSGWLVAVTICVAILAAYGVGGVYFSQHFIPGTTLNNTDVSNLTSAQAKEKVMQTASSYTLTLLEQDEGSETIYGEEIDLRMEISDGFNELIDRQGGFDWILTILGSKDYVLDEDIISYTYDEGELSSIIDNLSCVEPEYPVEAANAEVVLMGGEFKIVPECYGNVAHRDDLEKEIKLAVETQLPTLNLTEKGLYDEPTVFSDDPALAAKKAICDELVDMRIELIFGYTSESVDIQTISTWMTTNQNDSGDYVLGVNNDAIKAYAKSLGAKYDTSGKTKQFATTGGDVVEINKGDLGWIFDEKYAASKLAEFVKAKQSVSLDLTDGSEESIKWWVQTAVGFDANGNDYYGTTYAEVSIDKQHMWMYQDGKLVLETDVVTGNPNLGNDTPKGAFRIRSMSVKATLRGPGYVTPVDYWMVFADDVGFHDATWQPQFGGDFYLTNGSHGCVNMPLDKAGDLYDLIYVGMPVFVY